MHTDSFLNNTSPNPPYHYKPVPLEFLNQEQTLSLAHPHISWPLQDNFHGFIDKTIHVVLLHKTDYKSLIMTGLI